MNDSNARSQRPAGHPSATKKIVIAAVAAAVFVFILLLTKIANQVPPEPPAGIAFWMYAQHVVACTPTEITLVDTHQTQTSLEKDSNSWPDCSRFHKDDVLDFHLARGAKTRYLNSVKTEWWRKTM